MGLTVICLPVSIAMNPHGRTCGVAAAAASARSELWNVEQALDHTFPGWRQLIAIRRSYATIRAAFRKLANQWNPNRTLHQPSGIIIIIIITPVPMPMPMPMEEG